MDKSIVIENIIEQVKKLDNEARIYLMERLSRILKRSTVEKNQELTRLTDLNSLGSEIWENINIDQYVHEERQWD